MLLLSACIGVDEVTLSPENYSITLSPENSAILIDSAITYTALVKEQNREISNPIISWESSNPTVAMINENGQVLGLSKGTTQIIATSYGSTFSATLNVLEPVIVDTNNNDGNDTIVIQVPARIEINGNNTTFMDSTLAFSSRVFDLTNTIIDTSVLWNTSDPSIATIDENGNLTALQSGSVTVSASIGPIMSNIITVTISGSTVRTGNFPVGFSDYNTIGGVSLFINDENDLILRLEENFSSNNGPGPAVYLSNTNLDGTDVFQQGVEIFSFPNTLPVIQGPFEFNLSETHPTITIDQFEYVVILCVPFKAIFNTAPLNGNSEDIF